MSIPSFPPKKESLRILPGSVKPPIPSPVLESQACEIELCFETDPALLVCFYYNTSQRKKEGQI